MSDLSVTLIAATPIVASILLLALSPLITQKVKAVILGQLAIAESDFDVAASTPIPPHLRREPMMDYVEYASDAVQVVPATFLPIIGAIFSLLAQLPSVPAIVTLVIACIATIGLDAYILSQTAPDYTSRKKWGYSIATGMAILANSISLTLVLLWD